jgi:uncharacterized protein
MEAIEGKNIIITGANSGIGNRMMKMLLSKGNRVFAVDIHTDNLVNEDVIAFECDVSTEENVDRMFEEASRHFDKIDIFIANAGFPYYESMDYADWDRIDRIFRTNVYSPIYSYQKFVKHLDGRKGIFALTASAMGLMGMPGYTLYSATKFALDGFQDAVRLEKGDNVQLTVLYPVATDTGFFKAASDRDFEKPYPVQTPEHVAEAMINGMERGKSRVFPSKMFRFAMVLFTILPFVKRMYLSSEKKKFERFREKHTEKP